MPRRPAHRTANRNSSARLAGPAGTGVRGARCPLPRQSTAHQRPANDNISAASMRLARAIVAAVTIAGVAAAIVVVLVIL